MPPVRVKSAMKRHKEHKGFSFTFVTYVPLCGWLSGLRCLDKQNVPRPSSDLRPVNIGDLGAVTKLVAVFIGALRNLELKVKFFQPDLT